MDKNKVFREVQKQLSKGNIDKAISLWEEYVKENPDGNIYNTIGDLYLRKGDRNKAIEFFHKAASFFIKEGFSTKAQALYKKILHVNPHDAKALILTGDLYREKGLLNEAAKYYLASIEALAKENRRDEISEACKKVVDLAPENTSLRSKLAQYLQKEGFIEEASKEYMLVGKLFLQKGDDDNAAEFLEKAYELYPRNKEVYPLLINLYLNREDKQKAEKLLQQATELFPEEIELKVSRAEILKESGAFKEALELVNDVLTAGSVPEETVINALKLRAELNMANNDNERALDDFLEASEKLVQLQRYNEAEELLLKAKEISSEKALEGFIELYKQSGQTHKLVQSIMELADIRASSGQKDEASQLYQQALALDPENEQIKLKLQDLISEAPEVKYGPSEAGPEEESPVKTEEEKTISEKLLDVDIYIRYGLTSEAVELLEKLKVEDPYNFEVHKRLKDIYKEMNEKEKAIAECLALARLMEEKGDVHEKEKYINEALEIDPTDPRLSEYSGQTVETSSIGSTSEDFLGTSIQGLEAVEPEAEVTEETTAAPTTEETPLEDYTEELSEADFYYRQGLYEDALNIYLKLSTLNPDDETLKERIAEIQKAMAEGVSPETPEEPAEREEPQSVAEEPGPVVSSEMPVGEEGAHVTDKPGEETFQNIFSSDEIKAIIEEESTAQEPELEEDVFEIFEEFKKGISKEVSEEDYETHYNLGIAYKEMGLIDDAIKEFQVAKNSHERKVQTLSMLGLCYMEKGLYDLAVRTFEEALENTKEKDETYWSIKFDMAESYEKMGQKDKALALYTEIYGWDSKFRNVNEKVNILKGEGPKVVLEQEENKEPKKPSKKSKISYI